MLTPKTKRNISRIIPFGVIWFFTSLVFFIVEKAAIGESESPFTAIDIGFRRFTKKFKS